MTTLRLYTSMKTHTPTIIHHVFRNELQSLIDSLQQGVDPNERDAQNRTALMHASTADRVHLVSALLKHGASADLRDGSGNTALHFAAQENHVDVINELLRHGAKVDIEDEHGNTALWRAVFYSRGRGEAIEALLSFGADRNHRNRYGKTPLMLAETISNYDVKQFFK